MNCYIKIKAFAKKMIAPLIKLYFGLGSKVYSLFLHGYEDFFVEEVCKAIEPKGMNLEFKLTTKDLNSKPVFLYPKTVENKKLAIIMQGPVVVEENFTFNVAKYYYDSNPNAHVILSTWEGEDEETLDKFKRYGVIVVQNKIPINPGHGNVNLQKASTLGGILKARELGVEYVAKTRADQCVRKAHIFEYLICLLNKYESTDTGCQKKRIVTLASPDLGNMFLPYFFSDFFSFGTCSDMERFWSFDDENGQINPNKGTKLIAAQHMSWPEIFIIKSYLLRIGHKCDCSICDWWDAVNKYFICTDIKTLDIFWVKDTLAYSWRKNIAEFYGDYIIDDDDLRVRTENFDFVNWLNLYNDVLKYDSEYEKYLDARC